MDVVFALLAAVLHLCNIEMAVDPESEEVIVMNEDEMDYGRTLFFFFFFFLSLYQQSFLWILRVMIIYTIHSSIHQSINPSFLPIHTSIHPGCDVTSSAYLVFSSTQIGGAANHYYTHVKLGQFTNSMQKDWTTSIQAVLSLLKIKWQDRIPDTEVLKRAGMQSVHTLLKLAQLR